MTLSNMISHFNFLMYVEECQVTSCFFPRSSFWPVNRNLKPLQISYEVLMREEVTVWRVVSCRPNLKWINQPMTEHIDTFSLYICIHTLLKWPVSAAVHVWVFGFEALINLRSFSFERPSFVAFLNAKYIIYFTYEDYNLFASKWDNQ